MLLLLRRTSVCYSCPLVLYKDNRGATMAKCFSGKQLHAIKYYRMRTLVFVGSACSSSVFLWAKIFLMAFASFSRANQNKSTSKTNGKHSNLTTYGMWETLPWKLGILVHCRFWHFLSKDQCPLPWRLHFCNIPAKKQVELLYLDIDHWNPSRYVMLRWDSKNNVKKITQHINPASYKL